MSQSARRYGRLAEERAADRYGFNREEGGWYDGRYKNGTPVEVKAARPDGELRLWEDDHKTLARQQGYYVFGKSRPHGRGIHVFGMVRRKATDVTGLVPRWNRANHRLKGPQRQYKLPIGRVL